MSILGFNVRYPVGTKIKAYLSDKGDGLIVGREGERSVIVWNDIGQRKYTDKELYEIAKIGLYSFVLPFDVSEELFMI